MKSTAFIAILLTFLMALLVLGAVGVFLWQGRLEMQDQIATLEADVAALNDAQIQAGTDLANESATRAVIQAELQIARTTLESSEQDNIALEQDVVALGLQLTQVSVAISPTATPLPALSEPPQFQLFLQPAGAIPQFSTVDYTVIVGHPSGVAKGVITVNGIILEEFQGNGLFMVSVEGNFPADIPGELNFTVAATSTLGNTGTTNSILTVLPPTPTESPTPTLTPTETPEATNTPTSLLWPVPHKTGPVLPVAFSYLPAGVLVAVGIGG